MTDHAQTEHVEMREAWSAVAPGYDEHVTPSNMAIAEEALERAGLRPGMRVLDVAAGSGALSVPAARAGGEVLATDLSPAMVERLETRAREEGLEHLKVRVMDGQALDLEDDRFDLVGSQFGVMLFPDLPRGLREMVRVTRPGGRVLVVAMGPPAEVEFLTCFVGAIEAAVPDFDGLPSDPPPLPFQLADPQRLEERLVDAGLRDVRVETTSHQLSFESAAGLWDWVPASNPIGAGMVADLTEEERAAARRALETRFEERAGNGGPVVLNNAVNIGIGTK